ncbi:23124_t:CDS:2, partial [Racocetra persica]
TDIANNDLEVELSVSVARKKVFSGVPVFTTSAVKKSLEEVRLWETFLRN